MKKSSALLVLCLLAPGCSVPLYGVMQSQKAFLPAKGPPQPRGELVVSPDQVVLQTPVGFRRSARLAGPTAFTIAGKKFALDPQTVLVAAGLRAPESARSLVGRQAYCMGSKVCLIDSDADNAFDTAIRPDAKKEAEAGPVAITPIGYEALTNEPMPGESYARIYYRGKTGLIGGRISFDLQVMEAGNRLHFDNVRTSVNLKELPKQVQLMGAIFTVQSYDPATGKVTLDVKRGFVEGEYGITVQTRTQYIPIYIPG